MKTIKLKSKNLDNILNKYFKNYKKETMFYSQSLSSDYKTTIYNNKNNIIAIFYSDILFDECELIIY